MYRRKLILSFLFVTLAVSALATVKPRYRGAGRGAVEHEAEVENVYSTNGPRRIGSLATAALPSKGSPKVPVILVQFSDVKFTSGLEDDSECNSSEQVDSVRLFYEEYCNGDGVNPYWKVGGSFGAISEYFRDIEKAPVVKQPHRLVPELAHARTPPWVNVELLRGRTERLKRFSFSFGTTSMPPERNLPDHRSVQPAKGIVVRQDSLGGNGERFLAYRRLIANIRFSANAVIKINIIPLTRPSLPRVRPAACHNGIAEISLNRSLVAGDFLNGDP